MQMILRKFVSVIGANTYVSFNPFVLFTDDFEAVCVHDLSQHRKIQLGFIFLISLIEYQ